MVQQENIYNGTKKTVAVIPAAGTGLRMGESEAKQFLELEGKPMLALTLERFQNCPSIDSIVLVAPPGQLEFCQRIIIEQYGLNKVDKVIAGGERRQDSVRVGIEVTGGEYELVLIHDGVRPIIDSALIERAVSAATRDRAVITALPVKDTVKKIGENGFVLKTYERESMWLVQTPQVFRYEDILKAHRIAIEEGWDEATDDASLIERMGIAVKVIPGSEYNIKVTTSKDMELAKYLMKRVKRDTVNI